MNIKTNKIHLVCKYCGLAANYLTCWKKYGQPPRKSNFLVSTYHTGECDFCGRDIAVTETRDFFYPDFDLLRMVISELK